MSFVETLALLKATMCQNYEFTHTEIHFFPSEIIHKHFVYLLCKSQGKHREKYQNVQFLSAYTGTWLTH